jgi:hypothetical protein
MLRVITKRRGTLAQQHVTVFEEMILSSSTALPSYLKIGISNLVTKVIIPPYHFAEVAYVSVLFHFCIVSLPIL